MVQGYCNGRNCHLFPVIFGELGSWMSNPRIAPYCPVYANQNLTLCIQEELQVNFSRTSGRDNLITGSRARNQGY